MQLHELHPTHKPKAKKRVGRGGKRGTYSGHGIKGQKARAGRKFKPVIRESIKRYPKLRGYRRELIPADAICMEVNLDVLEKRFKAGETISPEVLLEKKIIHKVKGKLPQVKILGKGKITKPLTIEKCKFSKSAKEKLEKSGSIIK